MFYKSSPKKHVNISFLYLVTNVNARFNIYEISNVKRYKISLRNKLPYMLYKSILCINLLKKYSFFSYINFKYTFYM